MEIFRGRPSNTPPLKEVSEGSPYRSTLSDRYGSAAYETVKAAAWSLPIAFLVAVVCGAEIYGRFQNITLAILIGGVSLIATVVVITASVTFIGYVTSVGLASTVLPSRRPDPATAGFSYELASAIRGDLAGALASLDRKILAAPEDVGARLTAADLYAFQAHDGPRARDLFEQVLEMPNATSRDFTYAINRLVDLYLGLLSEDPLSAAALRRLRKRFPALVPVSVLTAPDPSPD